MSATSTVYLRYLQYLQLHAFLDISRNIARVRKHLSFESNQVLIHAFVTSKLDYCNSLYYGLPDFLIKKLQYVQNSAARLLTGSCKYDNVTPIRKELHWLPVQHRIIFKILTLTYKTLNTDAPQYLKDLLQPYVPPRNLRSSSKKLLSVQKFNLKTYGARAFSISAPILWNQLPNSIRHSATLDLFLYIRNFYRICIIFLHSLHIYIYTQCLNFLFTI